MRKPELIIFDLGRVLVDFDFRKVIHSLQKHSPLSRKQIHDHFKNTPLWDKFERGKVTPKAFFADLQKKLKLEGLTLSTFTPLWNDIFDEKKDTVAILKRLRGRYRLAMLSNVNVMHWEHIRDRHEFMKWFDHPVASYAIGHRKPKPEAFHAVLKKAKTHPSRALFFDDLIEHIRGAKALGIRAHQFKTAKKLRQDLGELL